MDKLQGIKPGDRVRVTFEADVVDTEDGGMHLCRDNVVADLAWWGPRACASPTFKIERIEPPLAVGDRVRVGLAPKAVVLAISDNLAWVRHDDGTHLSWPVSDLERIP